MAAALLLFAVTGASEAFAFGKPIHYRQGVFTPRIALGGGGSDEGTAFGIGGGVGYFFIDHFEASFEVFTLFQTGDIEPPPRLDLVPGLRYILFEKEFGAPYLALRGGYVMWLGDTTTDNRGPAPIEVPGPENGVIVRAGPGAVLFLSRNIGIDLHILAGTNYFPNEPSDLEYEWGFGLAMWF